MKKFLTPIFFPIFILICSQSLFGQIGKVKQVKLVNFDLQSSALISSSGQELSQASYQAKDYWFPVKVPTTVLRGLVDNHIYPSPYLGLNNMLIPDASDEFNKQYDLEKYSFLPQDSNPWKKPYWYRTHFLVPKSDQGKTFQLLFKGINYRAEVWLNGKRIADSTQMAGMFLEYTMEVSSLIKSGEENYLAVKIYPLDYPGLPSTEQLKALGPFYDNGGPNGDIGKNVTQLCSDGWDWVPPVRDRNMGIWQPVYLRTSGKVTFGQVQIKTLLPHLPDTLKATMVLGMNVSNYSNRTQTGEIKIRINPENFSGAMPIEFSKNISISSNSTIPLNFDENSVKALTLSQPHLWWPNQYGKANLYRIRLQFSIGSVVSDDTSFVFGIRTTETQTSLVNGFVRREFLVNGQKIHLVGGAWVPDMLVNRDSARFERELQLCKNANVNLVRIWGGGITPPDAFFESADRNGLLVWSDFWVTGDTQGEFKGSPDYPLESGVFIRNIVSTILRIRNHPSLLVWTGGNEGHARKELYDAMRSNIIRLDGTRPFIPSSSGFAKLPEGWDGSYPDNKPSGVFSGGPYSWKDPREYYRLVDAGKDWVFKDETGIPSQPPYTTLPRIITNLVWDKSLPYPLNNTWAYHDACSGNGHYELYYNEMVRRFGSPSSMEDFSNKMQLLNAIGYQGIFEAANHKIKETGGVMLWKLNAALPSVIWQIYDWYLEPNAGYYFMQNALEPFHVQFNWSDSTIAVVNRIHKPLTHYLVETEVYNENSKRIFHSENHSTLTDMGVKEMGSLKGILKSSSGISFVIMNLKDSLGKKISHNAYWISPDSNYHNLCNLPMTTLEAKIVQSRKIMGSLVIKLKISNRTERVAFFVRPQLWNHGDEVMPCFWSSSYFTLAPHETMELEVKAGLDILAGGVPTILLSGLNVPKTELKLIAH